MSFQHFRLGDVTLHQPLHHQPPAHTQPTTSTVATTKQPYGSGDTDDGYTLVFANLDAFQQWRATEEERNCVEFVKGDTHGSKADPPRFKDHTKLVCARHSRSGRKKYIKKHPERVRKVPSRKLDGQGCQASISYKTYFDTEEVRACYIGQHSHEIGLANLPFTRRGRKQAAANEKSMARNKSVPGPDQDMNASASGVASPSNQHTFNSSVSMLAPLPGQTYAPPAPQPYGFANAIHSFPPNPPPAIQPQQTMAQSNIPQERWENMATLFQTVRDHARAFEYPAASVAALETVLIRLYLESPLGPSGQNMGTMVQNSIAMNMGRVPGQQMQAPNVHPPMNGGEIQNANAEDAA